MRAASDPSTHTHFTREVGHTESVYEPRARLSGSFYEPIRGYDLSAWRNQISFEHRNMSTPLTPVHNVGSSRAAHGASYQDSFVQPRDCYQAPHPSLSQNTTHIMPIYRRQSSPSRHSAVDPDKFDPKAMEWPDYIAYFEQVAIWNNWSESEKAQRLILCL